jgi:hypothetical protein
MDDTELIEEEYADDFAVVAALQERGENHGCIGCLLPILIAAGVTLLFVIVR